MTKCKPPPNLLGGGTAFTKNDSEFKHSKSTRERVPDQPFSSLETAQFLLCPNGTPMAKTIRGVDGKVIADAYPRSAGKYITLPDGKRVQHWSPESVGVSGLREGWNAVIAQAHKRCAYFIHGRVPPGHELVPRRKVNSSLGHGVIEDRAVQLVLIDYDDKSKRLPPSELYNLANITRKAAELGLKDFGWLPTAKAYTPDEDGNVYLGLRLVVWLDRPHSFAELQAWAEQHPHIDPSVYQAGQPVYIAPPTIVPGTPLVELPDGPGGLIEGRGGATVLEIAEGVSQSRYSGGTAIPLQQTNTDGKLIDGREKKLYEIARDTVREQFWPDFETYHQEVGKRFKEVASLDPGDNDYRDGTRILAKARQEWGRERYRTANKAVPDGVEPLYPEPKWTSREDAAIDLDLIAQDFLIDGAEAVVRVTVGAGKTELVSVRGVAKYLQPGDVAHIHVPTLKLVDEVTERLQAAAPDLEVRSFKGRNEENCQRYEDVQHVAEKGGEVNHLCHRKWDQMVLCPLPGQTIAPSPDVLAAWQRQWGGIVELLHDADGSYRVHRAEEWCPFFSKCEYQRQLAATKDADVIVSTHARLTLGMPSIVPTPTHRIIDESPIGALTSGASVTLKSGDFPRSMKILRDLMQGRRGRVMPGEFPQDIGEALWNHIQEGRDLRELPPEHLTIWRRWLKRTDDECGASHGEIEPGKSKAVLGGLKQRPKIAALLRDVFRALEEGRPPRVYLIPGTDDHEDAFCRGADQVRVLLEPKWKRREVPTLIMDATITETTAQRLRPGARFYSIDIRQHLDTTQVWDRRGYKSGLLKENSTSLEAVQAVIDRLRFEGLDLVAAPKRVMDLLHLPPGVQGLTFGAERGLDQYKDCKGLLVVAQHNVPAEATWTVAAGLALLAGDEIPPLVQYHEEIAGLSTGQGDHHFYSPDPLTEAVRFEANEGTTIQTVGRLRALWADEPKKVWLLNSRPVPGLAPTRTVKMRDLLPNSPEALLANLADQFDGVCSLSRSDLRAHGMTEIVQNFAGDLMRGVPYINLIREPRTLKLGSLARVWIGNQKRPSPYLVRPAVTDPEAVIRARYPGQRVRFEWAEGEAPPAQVEDDPPKVVRRVFTRRHRVALPEVPGEYVLHHQADGSARWVAETGFT